MIFFAFFFFSCLFLFLFYVSFVPKKKPKVFARCGFERLQSSGVAFMFADACVGTDESAPCVEAANGERVGVEELKDKSKNRMTVNEIKYDKVQPRRMKAHRMTLYSTLVMEVIRVVSVALIGKQNLFFSFTRPCLE